MLDLGNFSPDLKGMSVIRGSVFRMTLYPSEGIVPKHSGDVSRNKYFVVLGIDGDNILVGSLLINTNINVNFIDRIAPYQYLLSCATYSFLKEKSRYVDCYKIKELAYKRIIEEAEYIGILQEEDIDRIVEITISSPVNKPSQLKKYNLL